MQKQDLKKQFVQSFKTLDEIVCGFDSDDWTNSGCGYQVPARIAFHILLGVSYYIDRKTELQSHFGDDWQIMSKDELPTQADIRRSLAVLKPWIEEWITSLDLDGENQSFPWAGQSNTGLAAFLLRHTMYHTGELNCLLYRTQNGQIEDLWMAGFKA